MSKDLEKLRIEQSLNQPESVYRYIGMSVAGKSMAFSGIAKWMCRRAKEDVEHGMQFYGYLVFGGSKVELFQISQAVTDYKSPPNAFEVVLHHRSKVTGLIHRMCDLAVSLEHCESQNLLHWFIIEHIEEGGRTQHFVHRLEFA
jgi:ferritin